MHGYTKLFGSILASTIWREDDKTRIVWITLLAMAGKDGVAEGSIPGIADFARVSIEDCRKAIDKLSSVDLDSRSVEFEGRRIQPVDGGFLILNHAKYRDKMNLDDRREYFRVKQAERRGRQKMSKTKFDVSKKSTMSTQTETQSETETQSQEEFRAVPPTDSSSLTPAPRRTAREAGAGRELAPRGGGGTAREDGGLARWQQITAAKILTALRATSEKDTNDVWRVVTHVGLQPDHDSLGDGLIAVAVEKAGGGLRSPIAAWRAWVNGAYPAMKSKQNGGKAEIRRSLGDG